MKLDSRFESTVPTRHPTCPQTSPSQANLGTEPAKRKQHPLGAWARVLAGGLSIGAVVGSGWACTGDPACSNCPKIEGTYAVTFDPASGVPPTADCQTIGVTGQNGTLIVTRRGATLFGVFGSRSDLTGILTDANDFNLLGAQTDGGANQDLMGFDGRYVSDVLDGGHHLFGTWTVNVRSPSTTCDLSRDFTAYPR